jgi:hypothetical protein
MDSLSTLLATYHATELKRIAAYTLRLEQIPLEEFRTSAAARALFIKSLATMSRDFGWIVEEIRCSQYSLADIQHRQLDIEQTPYEEFIALGKAALARFAACFPAVKDIVLDGTHEEIHPHDIGAFFKPDAADVMESLQADLTPRTYVH